MLSPEERSLRAKIAAETRWAAEPDRSKATQPARAASDQRFWDEARRLHPHGSEALIKKVVQNLRRAHMTRMAYASARAKKSPSPQRSGGDASPTSESELI
jgi:hypothetical protein